MGPSGAGKTTLLDVLSYRKSVGKWSDDIHLNGVKLKKEAFVKRAGYVVSEDVQFAELTVMETLNFAAALRLPGT